VNLEFDRIEDELTTENNKLKQAIFDSRKQIESEQESFENELKGRDDAIWKLNQEIQALQNRLIEEIKNYQSKEEKIYSEKEEERRRLESLIEIARNELKNEIKGRDAEIHRLNSELKDSLNERNSLRDKIQILKSEHINSLKELDLLKDNIDRLNQQLDSAEKLVRELTCSRNEQEEKITYLIGVLRHIQNRFVYRLYKRFVYRFKRIFFQRPWLIFLFFLNFFTNAYMSKLNKKHGSKIFPAQ